MAKSVRVLHVDDQPDFGEMAREFLERVDDRIRVEPVTTASDGLDRIADGDIDCVISDFDMPGTDGLEFLKAVRETFGDIPFILFTGQGTEDVASKAISAGVTDYFQKTSGMEQYEILGHRVLHAVDQFRTEAELEENKRRFRTLVEKSTDAIFTVSVDGTFEYVTPAVTHVLGYQPDELIGMDGFEHIHPDDRERVRQQFTSLLEDPSGSARIEYRYRHANGEWISLEARGRNLLSDELIEGVIVYARDVTERKRHKQTVERHERIPETLGVAVYTLDPAGHIIDVNDQFERLTGYTRADLVGESVSLLLSNDDIETGERVIQDLLQSDDREIGSFEEVIHTASGREIECSVRLSIMYSDSGEFVGSTGVIQDISDERSHDRKLDLLRRRSQALMYTETHEETARVATTTADNVIGAPLSGIHLLNEDGSCLEPVAVVDRVDEVFDERPRYPRDAEPGTRAAFVWRAFESGQSVWVSDTQNSPELTEQSPARSVIIHPIGDHGVFIVSSDVPGAFDDTDDALVEILATSLTSAMDRVDREQRLRNRERRLERLHDATVELMQATSQEEIAERAVAAGEDILGFPIVLVRLYDEGLEGLVPVAQNPSLTDILPDRSVYTSEGSSLNWEAYESGELQRYENVSEIDRAFDSDTDLGSLLVIPLGDYGTFGAGTRETGAFDETDVFLTRILARETEAALQRADRESELRSQQTELERQNHRLNEFASIVSHDLRNPLGVAKGRTELAIEDCDSQDLDIVITALDRMDQIIDRTLTLAREGQIVGETEPVALEDLIQACWRNIERADATLVIDNAPTVRADPDRLPHLFENLFRNAVEHGGPSVEIEVGRLPTGFYVQDDGAGIAEDKREHVLEAGHSSAAEGTGLGLGIVREIAQAHEWTVAVTESESGGARFEFTGIDVIDRDGNLR